MDAFDYLSVLISIVLGLGMTQLLSGFAVMVRARARIRMFWPVPLLMGVVFLLHVQVWWALFGLRQMRHWNFANFLVVLMQPVMLYLMAALITPDLRSEGHVDLEQDYFRETRWLFGATLAVVVISLAKALLTYGALPNSSDLAGHGAFAIVAFVGFVSRNSLVHMVLAPLFLAVYVIYVALLFVALPQ